MGARHVEALEQCRNAVRLLKECGYVEAKVLYTAAQSRIELCDYEGALADLNKAVELDGEQDSWVAAIERCKHKAAR